MPREIATCVERANLDPSVHVIALAGNGKGFCGGYDLAASAERRMAGGGGDGPAGSPLDPAAIARNHDPSSTWDPMLDHAMMSRNVRGFMSLFLGDKPVVCKVHGFCVAGGTDMALCSDLLVWRTWRRSATRLRGSGACPRPRSGRTASARSGPSGCSSRATASRERRRRVGPRDRGARARSTRRAVRGPARAHREGADKPARDEAALEPDDPRAGAAATQALGTVFDGIARHTAEGYAFQRGDGGGVQGRGAGARRAVRRRGAVDVQGLTRRRRNSI